MEGVFVIKFRRNGNVVGVSESEWNHFCYFGGLVVKGAGRFVSAACGCEGNEQDRCRWIIVVACSRSWKG
jgi:hypothetical protein